MDTSSEQSLSWDPFYPEKCSIAIYANAYKHHNFDISVKPLEYTMEVCVCIQALDKLGQFRSINQAMVGGMGNRSMQDLEQQFQGELQVKLILTGFGSGMLADCAQQMPIWATGGSRWVGPKTHIAS